MNRDERRRLKRKGMNPDIVSGFAIRDRAFRALGLSLDAVGNVIGTAEEATVLRPIIDHYLQVLRRLDEALAASGAAYKAIFADDLSAVAARTVAEHARVLSERAAAFADAADAVKGAVQRLRAHSGAADAPSEDGLPGGTP